MSLGERLDLVVAASEAVTPSVRAIRLVDRHGAALPGWQAGAHVKVALPEGGERCYSLVNPVPDRGATAAPQAYLFGVRLEQPSQGGSRYMHSLRPGDTVRVSRPFNNFPLEPSERPVVLVAGGIGVTPILSMAAALQAERRPYRLFYAGRARVELAFLPEIEALAGPALIVHGDDVAGIFDIAGLMASLTAGEQLYLCGPVAMIEAARAAAAAQGWASGRLRFEVFTVAVPDEGNRPCEILLKRSGRRFTIPADRSILDVLIEAGEDPLHDCKRGECGVCQVGVVDGVPEHRDFILSDAEKAAGKVMQICVSRAKTPTLVLDL